MAISFRLASFTSSLGVEAPSIWPMRMPSAAPMDMNTTLVRLNRVEVMFSAGTTSRPQVE